MKTVRNLVLILLSLCLVFPLAACDKGEQPPAADTTVGFAAVEDGAAKCRIVYPGGESAAEWKPAAMALARLIKKLTLTAVDTVPDSEAAAGREILLGATNRAPSFLALEALASVNGEYSFTVSGEYFVIAAADPAAASAAVADLEGQIGALAVTCETGKLVFPPELTYTYRKPPVSENEPWALFNAVNTEKDDASYLTSTLQFQVYAQLKADFGFTAADMVMQGACTDGTFAYFFLQRAENRIYIAKVDLAAGKVVKVSEETALGHANDACYNPDTGKIVVACNAPDRKLIKFIDPATLEVTGEGRLSVSIFGITYNAYTGQYAVGLSGGRDLAILDADFKVIKRLDTDYSSYHKDVIYDYTLGTDLLTQGIDSDGKYIYFVLSAKAKGSNWTDYLVVFDFEGKHRFTKRIPGTSHEVENIFHVGKDIYFSCNVWAKASCFKLEVSAG